MAVCQLQSGVWASPPVSYSHVRHQMPEKERTPVVASEMPSAILSNPELADEPSKPLPLFGDRLNNVKRTPQNDRKVTGVGSGSAERVAKKLHWEKGAVPSGESNSVDGDKREPMRLPMPTMIQRHLGKDHRPIVPNTSNEPIKTKRSVEIAEAVEGKRSADDTVAPLEGEDLEKSNSFNVGFYGGGWGGAPWGGWGGGWGAPWGGWGGGWAPAPAPWGAPYAGWGGWGRPYW